MLTLNKHFLLDISFVVGVVFMTYNTVKTVLRIPIYNRFSGVVTRVLKTEVKTELKTEIKRCSEYHPCLLVRLWTYISIILTGTSFSIFVYAVPQPFYDQYLIRYLIIYMINIYFALFSWLCIIISLHDVQDSQGITVLWKTWPGGKCGSVGKYKLSFYQHFFISDNRTSQYHKWHCFINQCDTESEWSL